MSDEHESVDGGFTCEHCGELLKTPLGYTRHTGRCRRRNEEESCE